ncbi:MAG: hypothetical protein WCC26_03765 [Terracidiphilus sp.]
MNLRYALIAWLLVGCASHEDPIPKEREAVKEALFTDVQNLLGDAIDGDLNRIHLYHHGMEGGSGVDYTLCGAVSAWEKPHEAKPDRASQNLFIITMRLGNEGRILGETELQFADASPTAMVRTDAPVKVLCSNSASTLPPQFEPRDKR